MKDIPLIRELLDPFLTVGEAVACSTPAFEVFNHHDKDVVSRLGKNALEDRVAVAADKVGADIPASIYRLRITA